MTTITGRKYADLHVGSHVYVSSDGDYHFQAYTQAGPMRWYCPGHGFEDWSHVPLYAERLVWRSVLKAFRSPDTKYYEKYQDGTRRYGPYRYHDPIIVNFHIQILEIRLGLRAEGEFDHPYGLAERQWQWYEEAIVSERALCISRAIIVGYVPGAKTETQEHEAAKAHLRDVLDREHPQA